MAQRYFPALKTVRKGTPLTSIPDFPLQAFEQEGFFEFELESEQEVLHLRMTASKLESGGVNTGTSLLIYDDTQNHRMMQELARRARRDDLTGLYNRATFFHDATMGFDLCMRQTDLKGCVLMMDIDFFKNANDNHGHAAGDQVLSFIGEMLSKRFRRTDICGRYGGEELCVWLPSTDLAGATRVAEEIRKSIEAKTFKDDAYEFNVTVSIGIASIHDTHPTDFDDLMKMADVALYEAKHAGRNQVRTFHVTEAA
jgi:diguanylate cyclase (GGDEF)-like protein